MVDPVSISVLTSAVVALGSKVGEGLLGEAGKDLWKKVSGLFAWAVEPEPAALPAQVATALVASPQLVTQVAETLKDSPASGLAGQIVIHAEKIGIVNNYGTVTQNF